MSKINFHIKIVGVLFLLSASLIVKAQDPHFTQFNAAPFTVNPAYTGVFDGGSRFMSNYRQQWSSIGTPYTTSVVAFDGKLFNDGQYVQNPFNMGIQFMSDKTMKGAFKSNFITATAAYHVPLNMKGDQSLGVGLSASYGSRKIDFTNLSTETQFTNGGFDPTLPNGEIALENMKPYATVGAGLLYTYNNREEGTFFDFGAAVYHLNKPQQTILYDQNEYVPTRVAAQATLQRYTSSMLLLDLRMLYQSQAGVDYVLGGLSVAKLFSEERDANMVGIGCWYRSADAVSPYVFTEINRCRVGFSYDIQINDIRKNVRPVSTMEFSLQWRLGKPNND
jgi:type IX secretion system PorP/SprF family membrane protein